MAWNFDLDVCIGRANDLDLDISNGKASFFCQLPNVTVIDNDSLGTELNHLTLVCSASLFG